MAEKYGRDFRVISRWKATSQICSDCGFKSGKLDLSVREWECLECGAKHDRDENAAINILVAPWVCLLPPAEELPFSCREAKRSH
ncbi:MAG: zinc ribbon domain-containing protein [Trichodesmium sp. MO_231.B1]|nr:zinc ribbon domain-containing protein [Trichodesmium sp. MO_231.B1]